MRVCVCACVRARVYNTRRAHIHPCSFLTFVQRSPFFPYFFSFSRPITVSKETYYRLSFSLSLSIMFVHDPAGAQVNTPTHTYSSHQHTCICKGPAEHTHNIRIRIHTHTHTHKHKHTHQGPAEARGVRARRIQHSCVCVEGFIERRSLIAKNQVFGYQRGCVWGGSGDF